MSWSGRTRAEVVDRATQSVMIETEATLEIQQVIAEA